MAHSPNSTDQCMNAVIVYGGLPMRRADVFQACLEDTGNRAAADLFAFGPQAKAVGADPMTLAEFREFTAADLAEAA